MAGINLYIHNVLTVTLQELNAGIQHSSLAPQAAIQGQGLNAPPQGRSLVSLMQRAIQVERLRLVTLVMATLLMLLSLGVVGVFMARGLAEARLLVLRDQLTEAIESVPEGFVLCDADDRLVACNKQYLEIYPGVREVAIRGARFEDIVRVFMLKHPLIMNKYGSLDEALAARMARHRQPGSPVEHELQDGRRIRITERRTRDGGIVGIHADITDVRRVHERLAYLANHDPLTGLANRGYVHERLSQVLARASRHQGRFAVMYLDLDRFKRINDTLGHHVGDELLRQLAKRLRDNLRDEDTLARLGGDEFMILLEDLNSADLATHTAQRLVGALRKSFTIDGHEVYVTTSIGIARYPDDGRTKAALMQSADAASYYAKSLGANRYSISSPDLKRATLDRQALEQDLRHVLDRMELELYYLPRIRIADSQLTGVEALLRWRHPRRGLLRPAQFMSLAEESGLILPMGAWILERACGQYQRWRELGIAPPRLGVNLSARQLGWPDLQTSLLDILQRTGMAAERLELDLTEVALIQDLEGGLLNLRALRDGGIHLCADDFGVGYSSLSLLKELPLEALKIDRSFIQNIAASPGDLAIVNALVGIGRALGLKVVAEGVESRTQLQLLCEAGCHEAQGYYFSRPMTARDLTPLLVKASNLVDGG